MRDISDYGVTKQGQFTCELSGFGTGFPEALAGKLYFSWKCRGIHGNQKSYRLKVSDSKGETYWDFGSVESQKSEAVLYEGRELPSDRDYRVWVEVGSESGERAEAFMDFSTGIGEEEWKAGWLKPYYLEASAPMFRKEFWIDGKVTRGKLYLCGLGYQEAYINGNKVNSDMLGPAWTNYRKRVSYVVYDVGQWLRIGENVCGVMLGEGWYGTMEGMGVGTHLFSAQLSLEYEDGRREWRYTDGNDGWMVYSKGPLKANSIYIGEVYDARDEIKGWDLPGYEVPHREEWNPAIETEGPEGKMVPQDVEAIVSVKEIKPVAITEPEKGCYVADFGQNMAGIVGIRLKERQGTEVTIRYAELVDREGRINTANLRTAQAKDVYISNGEEAEYKPRFTYHGFRYAQVSGMEKPLRPEQITAYVVRSGVSGRGDFSCSNGLVNKIQEMCRWTEGNNLHGVPTDCPQRDERLGWLNDLTVRAEEAVYNFEMHRFFTKYLQDIADEQGKRTGAITDTVPYVRYGSCPADPVCSSYLILGWLMYEHYGDVDTLRKHYEGYGAWTKFLYRNTGDGIVTYSYYGDWASPVAGSIADSYGSGAVSGITPGTLMSTGFLYYNAALMEKIALAIGKEEDVDKWRKMAEATKAAINRHYYHKESGNYASGSQGANTFMLWLGIAPEPGRTVKALVEDIRKHDTHLTTGNICSRYILEVLAEHGYEDVAYELASQTTYPSWGYMAKMGATTIWERWEFVESGPLLGMASHDHPMYASVSAWFYRYLLGIRVIAPGFAEYAVRPCVPEGLDWAEGSVETVKGTVKVRWEKEGKALKLYLSVPFNARCRLTIPVKYGKQCRINQGEWENTGEIHLVSGEYEIVAK